MLSLRSAWRPSHTVFAACYSTLTQGSRGIHRANELLEQFFDSEVEIEVPGRADFSVASVDLSPEDALQLFEHKIFWRQLETRVREGCASGKFFRPILDGSEDSSELAFCIDKDDPVFPHYRMGGLTQFRRDRGGLREQGRKLEVLSFMCAHNAHKTASDLDWNCLPVTPTIGDQLPDAFAVALANANQRFLGVKSPFPWTSVTWPCLGNGSIDHPTVLSAFNSWKWCKERKFPAAAVLVVLDNRIAIATRPVEGETERRLREQTDDYFRASGQNFLEVITRGRQARNSARRSGALSILHIDTTRIDGHSGQERHDHVSTEELNGWIERDSLRSMAQLMLDNQILSRAQMRNVWQDSAQRVDELIANMQLERGSRSYPVKDWTQHAQTLNFPQMQFAKQASRKRTMRQAITARLKAASKENPYIVYICQDPPGHYGRLMGLDREHPRSIFACAIDEIQMGGMTALGLCKILPVIENSYLFYRDQGIEAALNKRALTHLLHPELPERACGSIVCSPAFPGGPGGPTHNENSLPQISTPNLFSYVPSCAYTADSVWQLALRQAKAGYHVSINEPTSLYAEKDLFPGDRQLLMLPGDDSFNWGDVVAWRVDSQKVLHRLPQEYLGEQSDDLRIATYGRPVWMALRASFELQRDYPDCRISVIDYPCMTTSQALLQACSNTDQLLVIDDCRQAGSMGSALITSLVSSGQQSKIRSLFPLNSFSPSGPAQEQVSLTDQKVLEAARAALDPDCK